MISTFPLGHHGSVASLLAATFYQGNPDSNHKPWNIVTTGCILHMMVPMQSVTITFKVASSNRADEWVYSIQHYVLKFVSDL